MSDWTQPQCGDCWDTRHPGRVPAKIRPEMAELERCAFCGMPTRSGIYVRVDPATVRFPTREPQ